MLYRKYRPQDFEQVVGQEHVVQTLKGALARGRVGQAYLFAGPRGTGKTTLARILAKSVNCANYAKAGGGFDAKLSASPKLGGGGLPIPCNKCSQCLAVNAGNSLDLIEIDAASNRGIDEIRNLKESAFVSAASGGRKVFLIDEVHMLTKDAFNALLKILEEPPSHVVFILATTEPHKILPTVLSRVQRFDFKRLTHKEISEKLNTIAKAEGIQIDQPAIQAIAASADGALRDAEVSLTKLRTIIPSGPISEAHVTHALGLIPSSYHPTFLASLLANEKQKALTLIHNVHESGLDLDHFAKDFLAYARQTLLTGFDSPTGQKDQAKLISIITAFTNARGQLKNSPIPPLPLELAVIELTK